MSKERKSHPWWLLITQALVIVWLIVSLITSTSLFSMSTVPLSITFCILMHFISKHYKD